MPSYYHIRITYPQGVGLPGAGIQFTTKQFYYEINLADTEVIFYSEKYQKGEDIFFDGVTLFNRRIEEFRIFLTNYNYIFSKEYIKDTYNKEGFNFLGQDVTRMFISRTPEPPKEENLINITREGIFFKGQQYDAFKVIRDLLDSATNNITIIDGYIDVNLLDMLESREKIKIKILTHSDRERAIKNAATKFNQQYHNLELRILDDYHDRFVIIDEKDFYHFGYSIKDLGKKSFMFSLIEEPTIIKAFKTQFSGDWAKAKQIQI